MEEAVTVLYSEYNAQKLRQIILTVMYLVYTDMLRSIRYRTYLQGWIFSCLQSTASVDDWVE